MLHKLQIVETADGSKSILNTEIGEQYHSKHGAFTESKHVFVEAGLAYAVQCFTGQVLQILEVGFGSGLNYLTTTQYAAINQISFCYTGIEAHLLPLSFIEQMHYQKDISPTHWQAFTNRYQQCLETKQALNDFDLLGVNLLDFDTEKRFHLLYYDAFSVQHQPEMWSEESILHAAKYLLPGGVFVTYAITGHLKRTLKEAGFEIQKLPGAPGKKEMLRAIKI